MEMELEEQWEKTEKGIQDLEELEEIEQKLKELIHEHEYEETNSDTSSTAKSVWIESLSMNDLLEIEHMTMDLIGDYLQNDIQSMSSPHFHDNLKHDITLLVEEQLTELHIFEKSHYEELEHYISQICDQFFYNHSHIPPRSYPTSIMVQEEDIPTITQKIDMLKQATHIKQKTEEWYKQRNELLTASNIWKIFASEAQQNSLIFEKCSASSESMNRMNSFVNVNSTLHWGNKYEPLSAMVYENIFDTKIEEFGCMVHPQHPFIGASPDGIVTDPDSVRFGRMIEIKNIVNRDITGIPKEEYWIQMQIQMETFDLDDCDFVETRFKEYESETEIYENEGIRGIILYFVRKDLQQNTPHYVYWLFDQINQEKETVDAWIQKKKEELSADFSLYETQYWYLDEISIVTVKRNREWFQNVVPQIENTWKIIEKERVEGFEHRSSKKKNQKMEVTNEENSTNKIIRNMQSNHNVCLIKLEDV